MRAHLVAELLSPDLRLPALGLVAALTVLGYLLSRARFWHNQFGILDAAMVVLTMAIGTAAAVPLVQAANRNAGSAALLQDLHVLRSQIELYRAEHGGDPPLLYKGSFPQLLQSTDAHGIPGPAGPRYPYGPYLKTGIPANPLTGQSVITAVDSYPPPAASGNGGWYYHQPSGHIGIDHEAYLSQ